MRLVRIDAIRGGNGSRYIYKAVESLKFVIESLKIITELLKIVVVRPSTVGVIDIIASTNILYISYNRPSIYLTA